MRKRQCEDLVQAIVKMPEPERAVLSMLYDDALTATEVARRLRLSKARVWIGGAVLPAP